MPAPTPLARRRRVTPRVILGTLVGAVAVAFGAFWLYDRLSHVYVLDARAASEMVLLSSRVAGWVIDVPAREGAPVEAGDALLLIDDRQARLSRDELSAGLASLDARSAAVEARIAMVRSRTVSHVEAAESALLAAQSELAVARSILETLEAEWRRAEALRERNLLSVQEWAAQRNAFRNAEEGERQRVAEIRAAEAEVAAARAEGAEVQVLEADLERLRSERVELEIARESATAELDDHIVKSPITGVVDEVFIDSGEYVAQGQRVMVVHDPERLWIKANIKETDIRHVAVGRPVTLAVDAYPDMALTATVARVGGAARSEFALLPNPNPSGNFTKITQRIEVTMTLDTADSRLRPGLMVEAKIAKGD